MAECVAVTTDDIGTVTLQFDDCQNTNDGYICEICKSPNQVCIGYSSKEWLKIYHQHIFFAQIDQVC